MKPICLALLLFPLAAYCDEVPPAPADAPLVSDKIVVKGVRDPAIMPYADAYKFFTQVDKVPHDKVRMRMQIKSADKSVKASDIRIRLVGDETDIPVPLGEEGDIDVPRSEAALADKAEFVTNQKKGSLQVHLTLSPEFPNAERIAYADALISRDQAIHLMKEIVPWYFRLLIAEPNAIRACFEREGAHATLITTAGEETLPIKSKRQCAVLKLDAGKRESWQALALTPPSKLEFTHVNWLSDGLPD
ncbi:hypothetical protein GCM10025771_04490 [Niveibacterium umoris]|uniref:DUF2987 domain-containing protein n=1 Tax=Niveibacterium umoris TaxID=1193620 RepID=A0A840BL74_9RHOO|nr:hypothetical protein [Niveibacterium umoris]MBB4014005.1 hypothetical protein [Niveibacterium umoris]